MISQVDRNVD